MRAYSFPTQFYKIISWLLILFIFFTTAYHPALAVSDRVSIFTKLDLTANIETMGIVVSGPSLPGAAELLYRKSGEVNWQSGHPLAYVNGRLIGSLFGLSPVTTYEVMVRDGLVEISGAAVTQADEIQFTPALILRVDDNAAPGGDGSIFAPFNTIQQAVNRATPGTQVLVADGIYRETVVFPNFGSAGNWIQVKAEGSGAILDGSKTVSRSWTAYSRNVWFTNLDTPISYLARDKKRHYMYDSLKGLLNGLGHNSIPMTEGWYIAPNSTRLYVRSLDNPSRHTWQVPFLSGGFEANMKDWLWIEGFEIRYYGAYYGCGICIKNTSHVVIRKNKIHNAQKGIFIEWTGGDSRGNDTRIEYNEIYDPPVNEWQWKAVKGTWMEGTAIILRGHIGAIIRGNDIHHFFNGIYTGSSGDAENSALAFDADIYNNRIHDISDDALEPEGACVNQRFRNNIIERVLVGISLAPVTQGPVWALRNIISNYTGRSIKLDRNSDGAVFIYHNTSWTPQKYPSSVDFISAAHNIVMRNNIFQNYGYGIYESAVGARGNNFDYNNWYTTYNPRFKWENANYVNVARLCGWTRFECNGHENPPALSNPGSGDFTLLASSPNIDHGFWIPGINDNFYGTAPDIGAYESMFNQQPVSTPTPVITSTPIVTPAPAITPTPTIQPTPTPQESHFTTNTITFNSIGTQDGWVIESGENTNKGGALDRFSNVLNVGDEGNDKQYKGILSFVTDALPDDAIIMSAQFNVKKQGVIGTTPFSTHGGLLAEINTTFSGNVELVIDDFSAAAGLASVQEILSTTDATWYTVNLNPANLAFINKNGATQFRLFFGMDDNDDLGADYVKFFSGNAANSDQPQLMVTYATLSAPLEAAALSMTAPINQAPMITSSATVSIAENNVIVTQITATDAEALSYSISGGADSALFNLNTATGELSFTSAPDYEIPNDADMNHIYNVMIQVSDGSLITTQDISVDVTPVNDNVPLMTSAQALSIAENSSAVTLLTSTDADLPAQPLTYAITGGADASRFIIINNQLNFIAAPDYEIPNDADMNHIYNVTIQVSDGSFTSAQDISVDMIPVNDNAPVMTSAQALSIAENSSTVTLLTSTDADLPAQPLTYAITSGADASQFFIINNQLNFIAAPDYEIPNDADMNHIYNVTIQVSDGSFTSTQDISVDVIPVNDNLPVMTSAQALSIAENSSAVTLLTSTDADLPAQPLTYAITGGADASRFIIINNQLNFIAAPDFESPTDIGGNNIYEVILQIHDGSSQSSQMLTVTVTDALN